MDKTTIFNLGSVEGIPIGQGVCFMVNKEEVAVFRSRSGKITAIENRCPHRKGPLSEGIIDDGKVVCPLHGHKFDLTTGQGSESHECVRVFNVKIESNNILLQHSSSIIVDGEMGNLNTVNNQKVVI